MGCGLFFKVEGHSKHSCNICIHFNLLPVPRVGDSPCHKCARGECSFMTEPKILTPKDAQWLIDFVKSNNITHLTTQTGYAFGSFIRFDRNGLSTTSKRIDVINNKMDIIHPTYFEIYNPPNWKPYAHITQKLTRESIHPTDFGKWPLGSEMWLDKDKHMHIKIPVLQPVQEINYEEISKFLTWAYYMYCEV